MKEVTIDRVRARIAHIESLNARGVGTKVEQQQFELACLRELLELLALRERAEPVAYISKADLDAGYPHILARKEYSKACPMAVYSAPPAPVVPDELLTAMEEVLRISDRQHDAWDKAKAAVSACRAAMTAQPTKANNAIGQYQGADGMPHDIVTLGGTACKDEPVSNPYKLPDGWIKCSERMPEEGGRYWCYVEEINSLGRSHYQWNCSWNGVEWGGEALSGRVTHWMPLPAAPGKEG